MQVKVDNLKIIFIKKKHRSRDIFQVNIVCKKKASFLDEIQNLPP